MKILFGVCVALLFSTASVTLSTSVPDLGVNANSTAIIDSIGLQSKDGSLMNFSLKSSLKPKKRIPEPAAMLVFGTGLVGLAAISRRKMKK